MGPRLPGPARAGILALLAALGAFYVGSFAYLQSESRDFILANRAKSFGERVLTTGGWIEPAAGVRHQVSGWSDLEGEGTWSVGRRAVWAGRLEPAPATDLILRVRCVPYLHETALPARTVTVTANGKPVARWDFSWPQTLLEKEALIPAAVLADRPDLTIELLFDEAVSPADASGAADRRELGLFVRGWTLAPAKP